MLIKLVPVLVLFLAVSCNSSTTDKSIAPAENNSFNLITLPKPAFIAQPEVEHLKKSSGDWYDSVLAPRGFSGGMIVAKDGNIVFEKYAGTAHIPGTDSINANTPLQIASVSKTFTAMAVLKLAQDGKLHIDDEFSKYFPQFNYPGVTIKTLLNHRSGLPNYVHFMENIGWDKSKIASNQDVLNLLITRKADLISLIGTPNTHFSYCNTNYALLALLVEKVSGKAFPIFMYQTFFGPLQMKNTFIYTNADSAKANPSYDWHGRQEAFTFLDAVYGDKNVFTTPRDLLIWDRALRSNAIFNQETLVQAYTPYSNERPGIKNYGLGWRMNIYPDSKKMIFHNGWWHGSNACFIRLIKEGATIIVIGNKFNRSIYSAKAICNLFDNYYTESDEEEGGDNNKYKDSSGLFNSMDTKNADPSNNLNLPQKKLPFHEENILTVPTKKQSKQNQKLMELLKDQNKLKPE